MSRPVLSPEAAADLDEIWLYIARDRGSADAADRFVDRLVTVFLHLAAEPYMGRRRDELRAGIRSFPVGSHLVFYRLRDDDVLILRVLHGRRDVGAVFWP